MINPRVSSLSESTTLKITALTKKLINEGKDVVNFAAGEPDFDTPDFIKDGAHKAIDEGFTKYTPSAGIPKLRELIAAKLQKENNLKCEANNIIVTSGAKYALFVAIFALLDTEDEAIIPCPYWVSYPQMVKLAGAKTKFLTAKRSNNFKIDIEDLKKSITSKTKVLILNYPSNPTGATYSCEELNKIYDVVHNKNLFVISDEIYETLIYDGKKHVSFASLKDAADFTITINGFSKAFSMTGWRIGYLAAQSSIIDAISKIIDHTTSCASSISQKAAIVALGNQDWRRQVCGKFEARRNLMWEGLSDCPKLKPIKSEGTFYMFCDIAETGLTSNEFSSKLLEDCLVSCIPADAFGQEGFVRFSFARDLDQISKGISRIKEFVNKI